MEDSPKDSAKNNKSPSETCATTLSIRRSTSLTNEADNETIYPAWHAAVAGGIAGFGSRLGTAPLDLIRIRRQLNSSPVYPSESLWASWKHIVETEGGITALYRGNMAAIYLWIGYASVQFSVYDSTKARLQATVWMSAVPDESRAATTAFLAGAFAGVCATLATYPFDVCRTTFSARGLVDSSQHVGHVSIPSTVPANPLPFSSLYEPHGFHIRSVVLEESSTASTVSHSKPTAIGAIPGGGGTALSEAPPRTFTEFARQMFRQKGVSGFYAGSWPAVIQIIPYMGLNFALYDWLTTPSGHGSSDPNATETTHSSHTIVSAAYAGSVSGALSKICVYPLDTVKRRLQAQAFYAPPMGHVTYQGMGDCIAHVYRNEGIRSFYRGVVPSVIKTAIATSLTFALFRWTKTTLGGLHDRRLVKRDYTRDDDASRSR